MEFTDVEKQAVVGLLSAIIHADELVHFSEVGYLARLKYDHDISDDQLQAGMEMELSAAYGIISAIAPGKKNEVSKILIRMVFADNELCDAEYEMLLAIADRCGLKLQIPRPR